MSLNVTAGKVCEIVTQVTDYRLTPDNFRQWRNRGLFHPIFREAQNTWSRFGKLDIFEACVMAEAKRSGFSIGKAAQIARIGRDFGPGGINSRSGADMLVLFGDGSLDEDESDRPLSLHSFDYAKAALLITGEDDQKGPARILVMIDIGQMHRRLDTTLREMGLD
ncbi:hypothetical protein E0493_05370 [Roseomonas sp. M0104]|uniref:Uncharacterized protein n=1 Tax=Teichococcus coralli TaxID=2545983 RepID=A0A845BH38_9PROT|nr:hypothetical protein [Pseudoroseomonas coralli]MXP62779.1 hypothetical protein [Pseudoroseomonas coralli]